MNVQLRRGIIVCVLLGVIIGLAAFGWWVFQKAFLFLTQGSMFALAILTALTCTALLALTIARSSPRSATRLRARADAYEAALALVLRSTERRQKRNDWRHVRARLLLWGSPWVINEFRKLEENELRFDVDEDDLDTLIELVRAMRADLGQSPVHLLSDSDDDQDQDLPPVPSS